jgi:signal transduction histidine kinase
MYLIEDNPGTGKTTLALQFLLAFDRFRQEDQSFTRTQGGLGLGLAIVKHLVELHGGQVTAHSEGPNTGATFVVELPILSRADAEEPARAKQSPAGSV